MPGFRGPYVEEYDGNGNLMQIIYPSETKKVVYRYNDNSQITKVMHDVTQINIGYHPKVGKVVESEVLSGSYDCRESYTYSASLEKSYQVDFARDRRLLGAKFTYEYDQNFRLTQINGHFRDNMTTSRAIRFDEETGKLQSLKAMSILWPLSDIEKISDSFILIEREYDRYGRPQSVKFRFGEVDQFRLQIMYDIENRIHNWNYVIGGTDTNIQYIYDLNSNVIDVMLDMQSTWRYGYDNNGNINKITDNGISLNIEFEDGDRIRRSGQKIFRFDRDGFLVQRHDQQLTYNSNGHVTSITRHNAYRYFYYYDARGRQVLQEDTTGNVVQYFYANVVQRDQITHTFNQSTSELTQYLYDSHNRLIAMERSSNFYYIATDPMGTPIAVFNNQGHVVKQRTFNPLGHMTRDSNPDFDLIFGFQGGLFNPLTGLVFFGKRIYDPENGHWITPDYSWILKNLNKLPQMPTMLNNYQFQGLVNVHMKGRHFPMLCKYLKLYCIYYLSPYVASNIV